MKTVQMTLDDELLAEADRTVQELRTTRSAVACGALRAALQRHRETSLEEQHHSGYRDHPVTVKEFGV